MQRGRGEEVGNTNGSMKREEKKRKTDKEERMYIFCACDS